MTTNRFSNLSLLQVTVALGVLAASMFVLLPAASAEPIDPASLGNLYFWLDANDSSTLFQDTAGTIAAGNGDPVAALAGDTPPTTASTVSAMTGLRIPLSYQTFREWPIPRPEWPIYRTTAGESDATVRSR